MREIAKIQTTRRLLVQDREPLTRAEARGEDEQEDNQRRLRIRLDLLETENRMYRQLIRKWK
jgi:hypothetical protein